MHRQFLRELEVEDKIQKQKILEIHQRTLKHLEEQQRASIECGRFVPIATAHGIHSTRMSIYELTGDPQYHTHPFPNYSPAPAMPLGPDFEHGIHLVEINLFNIAHYSAEIERLQKRQAAETFVVEGQIEILINATEDAREAILDIEARYIYNPDQQRSFEL